VIGAVDSSSTGASNMLLFAAVHESGSGTFRTWRDVRPESVFGGKAEVRLWGRQVRL